ncbi:MAG TPA: DUF4097 family beta strand repeat-containing protein [Terriglobales bacterium]
MRKTIVQIVLLLAATWCVAQQGSVQKEGNAWTSTANGTLAGAHNLHIQVEAGEVQVEGGSGQGISYEIRNKSYESSEDRARRQLEGYKVNSYVRGDTAWIVAQWEGGRPHKFSSNVKVSVPRNMDSVKIETGGGAISVKGITGRVEGQSAGGAILLDDIGGPIGVETGGGHIEVGNVGSDLKVRTGGGNIRIGSVNGKVMAETGGGNVSLASCSQGASLQTGAGLVKVEKCTGEVKAQTGGGNIELGQIGGGAMIDTGGGTIKLISATGAVKAETGGGCIELWGVPSARVETGAGTITAKFVPGGATDSILETATGDITVYIVPSVKMTLNASIEAANGHTISSDFPQFRVSSEGGGGPWEKQVSADGSLNGGGPMLKIRTTMGNIYIRRAQ